MGNRILVFYGSYRSDRMGIRLAEFLVERLRRRGEAVELVDAKAVNLPMLDRMYKEYPPGEAPEPLEQLAGQIRDADGFVFVTGEYNWGVQPGLKNLTDHFLEEWFWRPAAIASYSAGRLSGARASTAWHGTLSEMGMVVVSSTIAVGPIAQTLTADAVADGRSRQGPRTGVSALRRRSDVVGGSSQDAATAQAAAILIALPRSARAAFRPWRLELDLPRNRHVRRIDGQLPISEFPPGWPVDHFAFMGMARPGIGTPPLRGRGNQHHARRRGGLAQQLQGTANGLRWVDGLRGQHLVGGEPLLRRRMFKTNLVEGDFQFLGDQHPDRGADTRPHSKVGHGQKNLPIAVDPQGSVPRAALPQREAQGHHHAAAGCGVNDQVAVSKEMVVEPLWAMVDHDRPPTGPG